MRNNLTYNERIEQNKTKIEYHVWNEVSSVDMQYKRQTYTQVNNINVEN